MHYQTNSNILSNFKANLIAVFVNPCERWVYIHRSDVCCFGFKGKEEKMQSITINGVEAPRSVRFGDARSPLACHKSHCPGTLEGAVKFAVGSCLFVCVMCCHASVCHHAKNVCDGFLFHIYICFVGLLRDGMNAVPLIV